MTGHNSNNVRRRSLVRKQTANRMHAGPHSLSKEQLRQQAAAAMASYSGAVTKLPPSAKEKGPA